MPEIADHARRGMMLFVFEIALFLITIPIFYKLVWIAILIISALGIWAAYNGREFRLPLLMDSMEKLDDDDFEETNRVEDSDSSGEPAKINNVTRSRG